MLEKPIFTVSGLRGVFSQNLDPFNVLPYVEAYVNELKILNSLGESDPVHVVIGMDSRITGDVLLRSLESYLVSRGHSITFIGIVPTPTVQIYTESQEKFSGGIIITSSHNPIQWNGLKFLGPSGRFLGPESIRRILDRLPKEVSTKPVTYDLLGEIRDEHEQAVALHLDLVLKLDFIPPKEKFSTLRVGLDTTNGAGGQIMVALLKSLGVKDIHGINLEMNGRFAHTPEPIPENLGDLCQLVRDEKLDIGIAVDPDVDRCVIIDENGNPLNEEYTLALSSYFVLREAGSSKAGGVVVKNSCTSYATNLAAEKFGFRVEEAPVGEINVVGKMLDLESKGEKVLIGGEGSGGVILPLVHLGRDALVAASLILSLLVTTEEKTISELKLLIGPPLTIYKDKFPIDREKEILESIYAFVGDRSVEKSELDGIKITSPGVFWISIRRSNTEPVVRLMVEVLDEENLGMTSEELGRKILGH